MESVNTLTTVPKRHLLFPFALMLTTLLGCSNNAAPRPTPVAHDTSATATQPKLPCPIKLTKSRIVHNTEEDVYLTAVNISDSDITAIAFGVAHTDKFGDTWTPYKTNLTSEDTIKRGHSRSMHWEVLMETPETFAHKLKPNSSELYVTKVAFADGRVIDITGLDGCDFSF